MTRLAQCKQVVFTRRATVTHWHNVMHFCRRRDTSYLLAVSAERMRCEERSTHLLPRAPISLRCRGWTFGIVRCVSLPAHWPTVAANAVTHNTRTCPIATWRPRFARHALLVHLHLRPERMAAFYRLFVWLAEAVRRVTPYRGENSTQQPVLRCSCRTAWHTAHQA